MDAGWRQGAMPSTMPYLTRNPPQAKKQTANNTSEDYELNITTSAMHGRKTRICIALHQRSIEHCAKIKDCVNATVRQCVSVFVCRVLLGLKVIGFLKLSFLPVASGSMAVSAAPLHRAACTAAPLSP